MPRTLLAVHAHPDDESSKGAATLARYADEGVRTVVVTCTGGEAGEILNPAMDRPGVLERMPELRRQELAKALEILDPMGCTEASQLRQLLAGVHGGDQASAAQTATCG